MNRVAEIEREILHGHLFCGIGGGAGTTGIVADRLQRNAVLIELNPEYAAMARRRIDGESPLFSYRSAAE